jgi:glycosyltransferase involved in cell wall biosynthesis
LLAAIDRWRRGALDAPRPDLSVILPAYNEEDNIDLVCQRLLPALAPISAEILIIDDGSQDRTFERASAWMSISSRIRVFSKPPPRGMGNAVRYGFDRARGRYIAITMSDGSDEVSRIPDMLARVRDEGYSLAIGSRYRYRINYAAVPRLYRFWSAVFRLVTRLLIGLKLSDYTNAFRVFDRDIFTRSGPEGAGFEISPEITFKAWFATRRVAEVDVKHLKRASGQSSFSFLRAGPGYGKMLVKALVQRLTGRWFVLDW